jgi:hypothetical protein
MVCLIASFQVGSTETGNPHGKTNSPDGSLRDTSKMPLPTPVYTDASRAAPYEDVDQMAGIWRGIESREAKTRSEKMLNKATDLTSAFHRFRHTEVFPIVFSL